MDEQLREAVKRALDRGWVIRGIAKDSGVPLTNLYQWQRDESKRLGFRSAEMLADWFEMRLTKPKVPRRSDGNH